LGDARRIVLALAVIAVLLAASAGSSWSAPPTCTDEFTGSSGGSWSTVSNWSAGVPGASSVVCWDASKTVVVDEGTQDAGSIAGGGGLSVVGAGRLELGAAGAASALSGGVQVAGAGTLVLRGSLACAGAATTGGTITDDGALECPLTVDGGGRLSGVGSVASVVNDAGNVEPGDGNTPGGLHVGAYRQEAGGTLAVRQETDEGGLTDHLLRATGPVQLDGTIALAPAAPPVGFLVIDSDTEPQGYFSRVNAPTPGSPWTIAYGPGGALAVSGGSVPVQPRITGALQAGGTVACALGEPGSPSWWEPRGREVAYAWTGPIPLPRVTGPPVGYFGASSPELLAEQLDPQLDAAHGASIVVPPDAVGFQIGCSIRYWMPAGGSQSSFTEGGESPPALVAGPYRSVQAPHITGTGVPGRRVSCSPGRWEGAPGAIDYSWMLGIQGGGETGGETARWVRVGTGPQHTVTDTEGGDTLACIVTAHYGAIAVPAEASVQVPARPEPTLCPRRPVALISARPSGREVVLEGAAVQRYFGARIALLRRARGDRTWRRIATRRVDRSGYFEVRVPARAAATGAFRVAIGRTVSNVLDLPGVLQIASERSKPGELLVDLRLGGAAGHGATVRVAAIGPGCAPGPQVAAATLSGRGDLRVRLTVAREPGLGRFYLATATVAGRTYSVELIVPARPIPLPID
jgi:hypothetical protein